MSFCMEIADYLDTIALGRHCRCFDSTTSTSDEAKEWARQGAPHGAVVFAARQSAGRGRRGRGWSAKDDEALLMSVVLRFEGGSCPPVLAPLTGVAVVRALASFGTQPLLKWPNDVLLGGGKVCGILAESRSGCAVVGIGINVNQAAFPPELEGIAASLRQAAGAEQALELVAARVLNALEDIYEKLISGQTGELLEEYRRMSATLGREVRVIGYDDEYEAKAVDMAADGSLIVELPGGSRVSVLAGDVSIRNIKKE